jgi:urease accessory protein UreH
LAILGRSDTPTLGTLVIVSKSSVDGQAMADKCRQVVESGSGDQDDKIVGLSCLPSGAGVGVKMIATETQAVKSVLKALASGARKLLTGAELPASRKY